MNTFVTFAMYASFVIAGLVVALNGIAPLTKTDKDDKVRDFFVFVHDKILAVILPFLASRLSKAEDVPAVPPEVKDEAK